MQIAQAQHGDAQAVITLVDGVYRVSVTAGDGVAFLPIDADGMVALAGAARQVVVQEQRGGRIPWLGLLIAQAQHGDAQASITLVDGVYRVSVTAGDGVAFLPIDADGMVALAGAARQVVVQEQRGGRIPWLGLLIAQAQHGDAQASITLVDGVYRVSVTAGDGVAFLPIDADGMVALAGAARQVVVQEQRGGRIPWLGLLIAQAQHGDAQASITLVDGVYRVSVTAGDGVAFLPIDADGMVALAGAARQVVVQEQRGGRIPWLGLLIAQAQHGDAQASITLVDGVYRVSVTAGDGVAFLPIDADGMVALAGAARQVVVQEQRGGRIPWLGLLIAQAQHGDAQASITLVDGVYRVSVTAGDGVAFLPIDADGMVALAGAARQVVVQEQRGGRIPWLGLLIAQAQHGDAQASITLVDGVYRVSVTAGDGVAFLPIDADGMVALAGAARQVVVQEQRGGRIPWLGLLIGAMVIYFMQLAVILAG